MGDRGERLAAKLEILSDRLQRIETRLLRLERVGKVAQVEEIEDLEFENPEKLEA